MARKQNILALDSFLNKGSATAFNIYVAVSCLGFIFDILIFNHISNRIFYNNLLTLSITLISFLLYYFKKINLRLSFGIILYAALANVAIDTFTDLFSPIRVFFFLRDSLFILFLQILASLLLHRNHAIIISSIHLLIAVALTIITKNSFMRDSLPVIILFVSVYSFSVYYYVGIIERTIYEREKNNQVIMEKNEIMNETNTLLEERQQQIEEQTEALAHQTEILKTQSVQLALRNNELQHANNTKDVFLSILAHDLRNPLNVIIGFSELLEIRFDNLTDSKKKEYIKMLSTTSHKTFNLLENLLQWARSQSNTIEFKPKRLALNGIVKENLFFFLENYRNKEIKVVEDIEAECFVFADGNMLDTIVRNLLSNAIKFTPIGGKIEVSCGKNEKDVIVEIRNTGLGIKEEEIENLFKIDKLHTTIGTSGEKGTGLGLLLCKEFIEKNDGRIWVSSKKKNGTSFSFSIPIAGDELS